jgi:TM2 domain-containing membrane protein YozV
MAELSPMELVSMQEGLTDQQKMMFMSQYNSDKKDRTLALILSILLGTLGIDRFYIGDMGIGILKLLTAGVCGILWIIDWFLIMGKTDEYNRNKARDILAAIKVSQ